MTASNDLFQDPCYSVVKQLFADFRCSAANFVQCAVNNGTFTLGRRFAALATGTGYFQLMQSQGIQGAGGAYQLSGGSPMSALTATCVTNANGAVTDMVALAYNWATHQCDYYHLGAGRTWTVDNQLKGVHDAKFVMTPSYARSDCYHPA